MAELQTYLLWEGEPGSGMALLIAGDPPARHQIENPRLLQTFEAASYQEARRKMFAYLGWDTPPDDEAFDYPPHELLR